MTRVDTRVVAIAYISFVILGIPGAMIGVLWSPHILTDFGQSLGDLGALLLAVTIGYFLGSSLSGRLFARWSVGAMLALGVALAAAGYLGYIVTPIYAGMVAAGLLAGFGAGVLDGGMNIYFAAHFDARLMNWLHASFGLGALLAPQIVNTLVIAPGADWRVAYLLIIVCYLVLMAVFWLTRARWLPVRAAHPDGSHARSTPFRATLALGIVWVGVVIFALYAGMEAGAGTWASPMFQARGLEEVVANNWVTAYWLSFTLGRLVIGAFATRSNTRLVIRLCLLGTVVGAALLGWRPFPFADLIGIIVFGFTLAPMFALLVTATQDRLGPQHAPNAIGFQVAMASVGAGLLPAVIGAVTEVYGLEWMPVFLLGFALVMTALYEWSQRGFRRAAPAVEGVAL